MKAIADLFLGLGALWFVLGVIVFAAFSFGVPFWIFTIARNIKRIRLQLERLNDTLDGTRAGSGGSIIGR
jgi:uncharacterized membrane protein YciS (DUF1049 family)